MRLHHGILCLITASTAAGQGVRPEPRVGYLHPAGASRGATIEILAGGQTLQGIDKVRVSGKGVEARVIKAYRPARNLDGDQRALLNWHIACRRAAIGGKAKPEAPKPPANPDGTPAPEVKLPEMPLLDLLGGLDETGIRHWTTVMGRGDRAQQNNQLGETLRIAIRVAADAPPGMREIRLGGPQGYTNPMRFEISTLPEIREVEPNELQARDAATTPPAAVPCVFNGQIQAGDVDFFRFRARRGANLAVHGKARALIPYLADAVPGWFQMVVTVRDAKGREIAYGDDFRFDPDPAFRFRVPEDGEYTLEIRDSIHRGREDFVYRVHLGELPFITSIFPLGGRAGTPVTAEIRGWNLTTSHMTLDTSGGAPSGSTRVHGKHGPSNIVPHAIDDLPETAAREPDNSPETALPVSVPHVVNGRIDKPGDVDIFRIEGRKGAELVIEVLARRLRSPLDAVIHVADETGRILAWNDDLMEKDGHLHLGDGLLTHHADPRVRLAIPADGPVFIRIADTQNQGGPEHAYRLRVTNPHPDFELRVTPSTINAPAGAHVPVRVHALRAGGFSDEIRLSLKDAPPGFHLTGGRIPAGANQARMTLLVPSDGGKPANPIRLSGTATGSSGPVTREAIPADDTMQAFLWRHLLPASEWLVCTAPGRGRRPPLTLETETPVRLIAGGGAEVRVKAPKWILDRDPQPEPSDPPHGLTVSKSRSADGFIVFELHADPALEPGFETNLIIDLSARRQSGAKPQNRQILAGLPAVPIIITQPVTP